MKFLDNEKKEFTQINIALPTEFFSEAEISEWEAEVDGQTKKMILNNCSEIPESYRNGFNSYLAKTKEQEALKQKMTECFNSWKNGRAQIICLLGTYGIGKTHLATSFLYETLDVKKITEVNGYAVTGHFSIKYATSDFICERYNSAKSFSSKESQSDVIDVYSNIDVLAVDEVGRGSDEESKILYKILNNRTEKNKTTVLCSNFNFEEFANFLGGATMDRLKGFAVFPATKGITSYRGAK